MRREQQSMSHEVMTRSYICSLQAAASRRDARAATCDAGPRAVKKTAAGKKYLVNSSARRVRRGRGGQSTFPRSMTRAVRTALIRTRPRVCLVRPASAVPSSRSATAVPYPIGPLRCLCSFFYCRPTTVMDPSLLFWISTDIFREIRPKL